MTNKERFLALHAAQRPREEIAEIMGVKVQTVMSYEIRYGVRRGKKFRAATPADIARLVALHEEGMPLTWICEDIRISVDTGRKLLLKHHQDGRKKIGQHPEWAIAWRYIRRSSILLDLHREFAPANKRQFADHPA